MFTGLVEKTKVAFFEKDTEGATLTIVSHPLLNEVQIGDSIAIDGACLTVNMLERDRISFFASNETLAKTRIKYYAPGVDVNFELPTRVGQMLGGHYVLGHVDTTSTVKQIEQSPLAWNIAIDIPTLFEKYVVYKGSVAVNGISLTINKAESDFIELCIIPVTLEKTNLSQLKKGDIVNLEFDILAKYTEKLLTKKDV